MEIKFITRDHRGGLKESLETEIELTKEEFDFFITFYYEYYGYDNRCNEYLWILRDHKKKYLNTWIGIKTVNSTGKPDVR